MLKINYKIILGWCFQNQNECNVLEAYNCVKSIFLLVLLKDIIITSSAIILFTFYLKTCLLEFRKKI